MASFISRNRAELAAAHYIRMASAKNYWFDFTKRTIESFANRTSESFCLIINGSTLSDDAYIIPYGTIGKILSDISPDSRGRWVGTITNDEMKISSVSIDVSEFYNRLDLLDVDSSLNIERAAARQVIRNDVGEPYLNEKIAEFNKQFEFATPVKKVTLTESLVRYSSISNLLKELHGHVCQLCGIPGFHKKSGGRYAEVHHIMELHNQIVGSHCSDNVIVVCPTCHRKLHYSMFLLRTCNETSFEISFDDNVWITVNRNVISIRK